MTCRAYPWCAVSVLGNRELASDVDRAKHNRKGETAESEGRERRKQGEDFSYERYAQRE